MFVLLDNSSGSGPPSLRFTRPHEVVTANEPGQVATALARIQDGLAGGLHAAGFFSYELGYVLEPRLAPRLPQGRRVPLLWFGLFDAPETLSGANVALLLATPAEIPRLLDIAPDWTADDYLQRFNAVHEKIAAGDIYQINLTHKMRFRLDGSPIALYRELRQRQPVPYGAIIDTGDVTVLSLSPEQFFTRADRRVTTRPMKGTAGRGATLKADAEARQLLASDPKQRAENLMIVDLMRNDLGHIAEIGSVSVPDLFTVETFGTVHQMTSGVEATLVAGVTLPQFLTAVFPPGSITGAPKVRAMELIADVESEPRGVYCGAIGYFAPDGTARFNVAIRTPVIFPDGTGEMGIGSGVVADSEGQAEYEECLLKMKFLRAPDPGFQLIETLLFEPGAGYWLLDRHMQRLAASAEYFGFACDEAAVRSALASIAGAERLRVRLLAAHDGTLTASAAPIPLPQLDSVMRCILSTTQLDSREPFLAHKTTRRELYDTEWTHYSAAFGTGDVIYVNERGELAEGSRTSIFVRIGAQLLTPPLASGALPGVLRAELLATGQAAEAVLRLSDLNGTNALYLGNSVRGLMRAELIASGSAARR